MMDRRHVATFAIVILSTAGIVGLLTFGPISQDPTYHQFADVRSIFGIPNFWNVASSLPMLIVGSLGLRVVAGPRFVMDERWVYACLYSGAILMGLGSVYYHLAPTNETLAVDRLGMTPVFASLLSVVLIEFVSRRLGRAVLVPMLLLGAASVLYWIQTERSGTGDLRLYVLVQYLPMLVIIPIVLLGFRSKTASGKAYWTALLAYLVAKVFEDQDLPLYLLLDGAISGHSLKHLVVALGLLVLVHYHGRIDQRLLE